MTAGPQFTSPLCAADAAFRLLTRGPTPLSLDGGQIGGVLPPRLIPLDELKKIMLSPAADAATKDATWSELATRARGQEPAWVIGAVGVAMPALRRAAGTLARSYEGDTADIDAEVLTGFLAALRSIDLSRPAIALRLRWAAYRAGTAFRAADARQGRVQAEDVVWAAAPLRPEGHPDLVLATAVTQGVITAAEAELIGATRLGSVPLAAAARDLDVPYDAARMRRSRAEGRLASAIRDGDLSGNSLDASQGRSTAQLG